MHWFAVTRLAMQNQQTLRLSTKTTQRNYGNANSKQIWLGGGPRISIGAYQSLDYCTSTSSWSVWQTQRQLVTSFFSLLSPTIRLAASCGSSGLLGDDARATKGLIRRKWRQTCALIALRLITLAPMIQYVTRV